MLHLLSWCMRYVSKNDYFSWIFSFSSFFALLFPDRYSYYLWQHVIYLISLDLLRLLHFFHCLFFFFFYFPSLAFPFYLSSSFQSGLPWNSVKITFPEFIPSFPFLSLYFDSFPVFKGTQLFISSWIETNQLFCCQKQEKIKHKS